jgi:hypothetical protein
MASLTEQSLPTYNKLQQIRYEPQQVITSPIVSNKSNIANHFVGTWQAIFTLSSPLYGVRRYS